MLQSAFNSVHDCSNKNNETLIKLGDKVVANSKFGLKRKIDVLAFLLSSKVSEARQRRHIHDQQQAVEELTPVKKPVHQEVILVNDKWDKTEW